MKRIPQRATPLFLAAPLALLASVLIIHAEAPPDRSETNTFLLIDSLGKVFETPTNDVPASLLPPASIGMQSQLPTPNRGASQPDALRQRSQQQREGKDEFEWFPATQPRLMSYLASQDEFGNTAVKPGPLIRVTPFDVWPQQAKYRASEIGLRYSFAQTLNFVSMCGVQQGDSVLGFYTFDWQGKWAIFDAPQAGSAGWLSFQIEAKTGLGGAGDDQSARSNLGTITQPTGIWSAKNGFRIPELAWQQSFRDGEWVVAAGMVSQGNYFDANSYANSGRGQFMNSALINSMVIPLQNYCWGANIQWQPVEEWYAMIGASAGEGIPGRAPWTDFTWDTWSLIGEFGYAPTNLFGLGPGAYRIQPFVAQADGGATQGGLCFNLQQQLGEHAPFGWFGRFGFGGAEATAGAQAQVGTGFVVRGPLALAGLFPSRDHDAAGIGFVWSQPSAASTQVIHENEYVLDGGYVLLLTPTVKLQTDLQFVWNPAFNTEHDHGLVFQLQLLASW